MNINLFNKILDIYLHNKTYSQKELDKFYLSLSQADRNEIFNFIKEPQKLLTKLLNYKQKIYLNNINFNKELFYINKEKIKKYLIDNNLLNEYFCGLFQIKNNVYLCVVTFDLELEILRQSNKCNFNLKNSFSLNTHKEFIIDLFPYIIHISKFSEFNFGKAKLKFTLNKNKIKFKDVYIL